MSVGQQGLSLHPLIPPSALHVPSVEPLIPPGDLDFVTPDSPCFSTMLKQLVSLAHFLTESVLFYSKYLLEKLK